MTSVETEAALAELAALREETDAKLDDAARQIYRLNEENDLLAEANELLREENNALKAQLAAALATAVDSAAVDVAVAGLSLKVDAVDEALLTPGNEAVLPVREASVVDQAHVMNILSVSGHFHDSSLVASGGADKYVKVHNWQTKTVVDSYDAGAPVLALSFHPSKTHANYLMASGMDGRHHVLRLDHDHLHIVQVFHDHTRQGNIRHAWLSSGDALGFVTGASDKVAHVYHQVPESSGNMVQFSIAKSYYFNGTVEALTVVPPRDGSNELVVAGIRDDCYVHYIDMVTLEKTRYRGRCCRLMETSWGMHRLNMNTDDIEHVSYTIMDLQSSPSGAYLLVATDANRHFVVKVWSSRAQQETFDSDMPRVAWHASEQFVVSNTEGEGGLVMWSVASEKVVQRVKAHEKLLRDLWYAQVDGVDVLVTGSYDKALKLWQSERHLIIVSTGSGCAHPRNRGPAKSARAKSSDKPAADMDVWAQICLYIVQILSLWTSPYVGFTGLYYYTPRDLGDKIMAQFPSKASTPHNITAPESSSSGANSSTDAAATTATEVHKCEDQEIFQSTYSGDNHVAAIVRKCNVVSSSAFHHQLVHSPDVGSTYLCRYAFHAWKFPSPFTKLITDEDRVRVRLGDDCQVDVPPFQEPTKSPIDAKTDRKTEVVECLDFPPDEAVDATEATPHHHGLRRWEPRLADAAPLTAFLTLVECIQIGVGNVVYAWHDKAKEQILSVLEEYTGDHSFRVVYLDGSGSLDVDVQFVRGLVSTDEALMLLHDAGYNYRIATEQVGAFRSSTR
ncbi:hypothetical protein DYB32_006343 [Aphanomyces invadans]|uniref:Serine-threonine kinase receptor-associated protein n=1 Tax=Aphanomyces invadans TaxID=157072 RepID=A0A418AXT3_9STRA|nr:hypothetical protein DYB32_006343 [Aphanomyces invadans]